jgi:hypothetical protein
VSARFGAWAIAAALLVGCSGAAPQTPADAVVEIEPGGDVYVERIDGVARRIMCAVHDLPRPGHPYITSPSHG